MCRRGLVINDIYGLLSYKNHICHRLFNMGDVNKNKTFGKQKRSQIRNKIQQAKIIKYKMSDLVSEYFSNTKVQSIFINEISPGVKDSCVNNFDIYIGNSKAFRCNKSIPNDYILVPTEFENFQQMITSFFL